MSKRHLQYYLAFILLIALTSCSVLFPEPLPTVPPPVLTLEADDAGEVVSNAVAYTPSGTIVEPQRDVEIVNLMNEVSEQSLFIYVKTLTEFGTRNSFSDPSREDWGVGAARRWIAAEFQRVGGDRMQVNFQEFPLTYEGLTAPQQNILATLPGVSPYAGTMVIGAHYDSRLVEATDGTSISPSANDNASGVAMLIELARVMSSRTWNQTIIFVAFAAEEQETAGSRRFVTQSILNNQQIDMAISNDTVGGRAGIPQYIRVFAPNIATSKAGQMGRYVQYLNNMYLPEFPVDLIDAEDREGRYGDQREFLKQNIAALRFTESVEDSSLLNSPTDTYDKIDYQYLSNVTKLNLITLANWAGAPPPVRSMQVSNLSEPGQYLVTWIPDQLSATYAVSFRPINQLGFPIFRLVSAEDAGSVPFTDLDPNVTYAVSVAPVSLSGRIGGFSPEVYVP